MAKEYDRKSSVAHWLGKLQYDFAQNNEVSPPPALYLEVIDLLLIRDAATWLDTTPRMRWIIDTRDQLLQLRYKGSRRLSKSGFQQVLKSAVRVSAVVLHHAGHADS